MIYLSYFLAGLVLLLAACLVCAAIVFLHRDREWRKREIALIDKLLKQAHIPPVQIERERVVKLPDAEIPPPTWIDQAFFEDEIKEELEQVYPEVARMSHAEARSRYAMEWGRIQKQLQAERMPLRAE